MTTKEIQIALQRKRQKLDRADALAKEERHWLERAEELCRELVPLEEKTRRLEANVRAVLNGGTQSPESNFFASGEGSCSNAFPAASWKKPVTKVIEVTGKKKGAYVGQRWFSLDKAESAKKHLASLDQGNAWISEAWVADQRVVTGRRKRVQLSHPHAIERKAVYEL